MGKKEKKRERGKNNMFDFRGTIDGNTIIQTRAGFKRANECTNNEFVLKPKGYKPIKVSEATAKEWVEVKTELGSVVCSGDCLFATEEGLVPAKELKGRKIKYALNNSRSYPVLTQKELHNLQEIFTTEFWEKVGEEYALTGEMNTYVQYVQNLPKKLLYYFMQGMNKVETKNLSELQKALGWTIMLKQLESTEFKKFGLDYKTTYVNVIVTDVRVIEHTANGLIFESGE